MPHIHLVNGEPALWHIEQTDVPGVVYVTDDEWWTYENARHAVRTYRERLIDKVNKSLTTG